MSIAKGVIAKFKKKCAKPDKQRAYNKAKKSGKDSDWSKYRNMKKSMRNQLKSARDTYVSDYLGMRLRRIQRDFGHL